MRIVQNPKGIQIFKFHFVFNFKLSHRHVKFLSVHFEVLSEHIKVLPERLKISGNICYWKQETAIQSIISLYPPVMHGDDITVFRQAQCFKCLLKKKKNTQGSVIPLLCASSAQFVANS